MVFVGNEPFCIGLCLLLYEDNPHTHTVNAVQLDHNINNSFGLLLLIKISFINCNQENICPKKFSVIPTIHTINKLIIVRNSALTTETRDNLLL